MRRDSLSSGERKGKSLNPHHVESLHCCGVGVVGLFWAGCKAGRGVRNPGYSGMLLGRATGEGESPVHEICGAL